MRQRITANVMEETNKRQKERERERSPRVKRDTIARHLGYLGDGKLQCSKKREREREREEEEKREMIPRLR